MFKLDMNSLKNSLNNIQEITLSKNEQSNQKFEFKPFKAKNSSSIIAAIDGSNHNIQGLNFTLTNLRTGYLLYKEGKLLKENIDSIKMEILINSNDPQIGYKQKYRQYYKELTSELPEEHIEIDKAPDRLRTLMEWGKISHLIENVLNKDDIIIFDGSLISGAISTNHLFFEELKTKANEKGISLVGLSKDSGLSINNAPISLILSKAAKKQCPKSNWYVQFDLKENENVENQETYFIKFTKRQDLIFRFDVFYPTHSNAEDIISKISAYCFDTQTLGYPYPMQKIHDSVRISDLEKEQCFFALKTEWTKEKMTGEEFDSLFFNYHKQLDIISHGR